MSVHARSILDVIEVVTTDALPKVGARQVNERDLQSALLFIALGEPAREVARKMDMPFDRLEQYLKSEQGVNLLVKLQTGLFEDPMVRVKRLQHMALDAQTKLLLRGGEAVMAKVADSILDRGSGRSAQKSETNNTISVGDIASADRMLEAQREKLERLEAMQAKLLKAQSAMVPVK